MTKQDKALVVAFSAAMSAGILSNVVGVENMGDRFLLTYGTGLVTYATASLTGGAASPKDKKKKLLKR